jgi:hypothetical protein
VPLAIGLDAASGGASVALPQTVPIPIPGATDGAGARS